MRFTTLILTAGMAILGSETALAQPSHSQSDVLRPKSTSPFEIAKTVNQSGQISKKSHVQINVDLQPLWKSLRIDAGDFATCPGDCEGKIFKAQLNERPGKEVILKLTKSFDFCRYLIFELVKSSTSRKFRWKLLGDIDHDFNRYEMADHRIVRAFGRKWFVLRGQEGSGSGYYLYGETWFEITHQAVRPVLHYSVDGHTDPVLGGLKWDLKAQPLPLRTGNDRDRIINLTFSVFYTAQDFDNPAIGKRFVVKRQAYFVWDKHTREFSFDPRRSTISEHEMDLVANLESEPLAANSGVRIGESTFFSGLKDFVGSGFEVFLRLNLGRLLKIAHGRDDRIKGWLRQFLNECDDTPEKLALERAMND